MQEFEVFQIEISKTYGKFEWHEDIKKVLKMAGEANQKVNSYWVPQHCSVSVVTLSKLCFSFHCLSSCLHGIPIFVLRNHWKTPRPTPIIGCKLQRHDCTYVSMI